MDLKKLLYAKKVIKHLIILTELGMIVMILILLLFSISLCSENIGFNFTFELQALVFAIGMTGLVCSLILKMLVPMNRDSRKYRQIKNLYIFGI